MATRKKAPPPATQPSFPFPSMVAPPSVPAPEIRGEMVEVPMPETVIEERKLRLVPPPDRGPEEEVSVEPLDDGRFVVAITRNHGGTVAAVLYSRRQLEMLLARIPAALKVG